MNKRTLVLACILLFAGAVTQASDVLSDYVKHRFSAERLEVREVQGLTQRITDGKLHLHIHDFIELVLKNSADIQMTRLDVYTAANQITNAKTPFDPALSLAYNTQRSVFPLIFGGGFGSSLPSGS